MYAPEDVTSAASWAAACAGSSGSGSSSALPAGAGVKIKLAPNSLYLFRISVETQLGRGGFSEWSLAGTHPTPPEAPSRGAGMGLHALGVGEVGEEGEEGAATREAPQAPAPGAASKGSSSDRAAGTAAATEVQALPRPWAPPPPAKASAAAAAAALPGAQSPPLHLTLLELFNRCHAALGLGSTEGQAVWVCGVIVALLIWALIEW